MSKIKRYYEERYGPNVDDWPHTGVPEQDQDVEENWVVIEFSDGTRATIVVDDNTADIIAGLIESATGLNMNVRT
jgi:hypothetical protein